MSPSMMPISVPTTLLNDVPSRPKAGIPREEIEEAFGRLFEDRMAEAIDHAADVEVDRLAAEDD